MNEKSVSFAKSVNERINIEEMDINVQEEIPTGRVRIVKRRAGEIAADEPIVDSLERYRVNQFLVICDMTFQSLSQRFSSEENNDLIQEMSYFHPDSFPGLAKQKSLKLPFLARVIKINGDDLVNELKHFANHFGQLSTTNETLNYLGTLDIDDTEEEEEEEEFLDDDDDIDNKDEEKRTRKCRKLKPCNKCLACCFILLCKLNLHILTYTNLHRAYEYFMTLPCTEVACERAFSKLKIIKSRLRSALLQQHLEPLLLMYVERELTYELDSEEIVKSFARTSSELRRLLIE